MLKFILGLTIGILLSTIISGIIWLILLNQDQEIVNPESELSQTLRRKNLQKFSFAELAEQIFHPDKVEILDQIEKTNKYTSNKFVYYWDNRKISGQINIPSSNKDKYPVVILIRGYAPIQFYQTGFGTRNVARFLAENDFITIAPDFLGYGSSDNPENDIWWERFSKPSQILQLISSLPNISNQIDIDRVGIWGHSNGGQIAISILEITSKDYPTSLWAPVTAPFPYSILYYTDTSEDEGQQLRSRLSNFEWEYDAREYSITQYLSRINTSINLHQGGQDPDVPTKWSDRFYQILKSKNVDISYNYYPNSDHNMRPDWNQAVAKDLIFFQKHLTQ